MTIETPLQLTLRFGIPTLDVLLGKPRVDEESGTVEPTFGIGLNSRSGDGNARQDAVSACLVGVDGVGKSILAMHLAAQYRADLDESLGNTSNIKGPIRQFTPTILYVSTDLTFGRADVSWRNFGLNYPTCRICDPFDVADVYSRFNKNIADERQVHLKSRPPLNDSLGEQHEDASVGFIDLATNTTGDDWAFINRLVGSLEEPKEQDPKHLLVVDAVEGLEVLVGDIDAYGQHRDRRSRVAQLIRTAADKCHLIFLVEAAKEGEKTPEEFVADAVVRLGSRQVDGYVERFVQVEKVRAQAHVPGPHSIVIRPGNGSTTGTMFNPDDPPVCLPSQRTDTQPFAFFQDDDYWKTRATQSYVYVFHSLNLVNRRVMTTPGRKIETRGAPLASFGIENLDNMLCQRLDPFVDGEALGISTSDPIALIGEDGTYKSKLSKAFLARTKFQRNVAPTQAAILITTKTLETEGLRERMEQHLDSSIISEHHHVICRRLEVHMQSAESLFHVILQSVRRAQATLFLELDEFGTPKKSNGWLPNEEDRRAQGWRIRLVIDNWTAIRDMYPQVRDDPLFLPCLLFFLRREGIATLIVANEDRGFSDGFVLKATRRLRDLTAMQLFTWRVPYFGESRVAITVTPAVLSDGRGSVIRELTVLRARNREADGNYRRRSHSKSSDSLKVSVNRSFELYDGLELGKPKYVPLRVHLYAASKAVREYFDDIGHLLERLTNSTPGEGQVIREEDPSNYDRLREFCELQGIARYPYTLVMQVDEYWSRSQQPHQQAQLTSQKNYLTASTAEVRYEKDKKSNKFVATESFNFIMDDPFRLFQPSTADREERERYLNSYHTDEKPVYDILKREDFFTPNGYNLKQMLREDRRVHKVPYSWDFGFMMVNRCAWKEAEIDYRLPVSWEQIPTVDNIDAPSVSWRAFAESCIQVAKKRNAVESGNLNFVPFAISHHLQETVSCLFLEIWTSEILANEVQSIQKLKTESGGSINDISLVFPNTRERESVWSLPQAMTCFEEEACRALLVMSALLPPEVITDDNYATPQNEADNIPVSVRTWFSTAQSTQEARRTPDIYIPARLPGLRSVRGDWFLATARGSRSYQMGDRAIDILCSRRANILRLQLGIGLPVRDVLATDQQELWTPLWHHTTTNRRSRKVTFHELRKLGAGNDFDWFWRSPIQQYDRHARLLRRWICSSLRQSEQLLGGMCPLEAYDQLNIGELRPRIKQFVEALDRATVVTPMERIDERH